MRRQFTHYTTDFYMIAKSNFQLKYGGVADFLAGLEAYIGRPKDPNIVKCMEAEHNRYRNATEEFSPSNNEHLVTTPAEEWLFVT